MSVFEVIWLLTNQQPISENHVIGTYMVTSMPSEFKVGQATAIAVILFLIVFFGSIATLRMMQRERVEHREAAPGLPGDRLCRGDLRHPPRLRCGRRLSHDLDALHIPQA